MGAERLPARENVPAIAAILREGKMRTVLLIVDIAAGYRAVGRTIYANRVVFSSFAGVFVMRVISGTLPGWRCIPWAILRILTAG